MTGLAVIIPGFLAVVIMGVVVAMAMAMIITVPVVVMPPAVVLVKLLGAFRAFEIVTLTGNPEQEDGQWKDREKFHRAALVGGPPAKSNPQGSHKFTL